jgi:L-fuculose-phosphate aldolase
VNLRPIGTVTRLSGDEFALELRPELREGLLGVAPGDRLDVLYWMHGLPPEQRETLQVYPRGDRSRGLHGVFGLRSPMRPNPIGVSTVTLRRVDETTLYVDAFDAFDGSPIVDIKAARRRETGGGGASGEAR